MYFVDREKIEKTLLFIEQLLTVFKQQKSWESSLEKLSLERVAHMTIEAILDVGNSMIDGFIMRDPGSFEDIIDILIDEKVLSESEGKQVKAVISLRKPLVQEYLEIDHQVVQSVIEENFDVLNQYASKIRHYLETELAPVSAFKQ